MDSDEEILSSYSSLTVTSRTETTVSVRDSVSKTLLVQEDDVFEDASSDITILTKRVSMTAAEHLDRSKMRLAEHKDLCLSHQKVLEPLFLRKCEMHRVHHGTAPPNVSPIQKAELTQAFKKLSGHSALLVSLDAPTFCVRYLAANAKQKPKNVLVYASPLLFVRFVVRPDAQRSNQSKFEDESQDVRLLMPPEEAYVAQKMLPKWQTVTFTLAFGKHVAVKYRVIETRKQAVQHVKVQVHRVKKVSTSTLYRTEPVQKTFLWRAFPPNELKLSTVEREDPQIVKRVFLEQSATWQQPTEVVAEKKISRKVTREKELSLMWQRNDEKF